MDKYIPKRLQRQALVTTHDSIEKAIEAAALCLVTIKKSIHLGYLLHYLRTEASLTRCEVRKAVNALAKVGRVRIEQILGHIIVSSGSNAVQNGGAQ